MQNAHEELVGVDGIGPKSLRALALISEVVHDAETSIDYTRDALRHSGVEDDTR